MTRGTLYLIADGRILSSEEFNGDMYGSPKDSKELQRDGHYNTVIKLLKTVRDEDDFRDRVEEFAKIHNSKSGYVSYPLTQFLSSGELNMRKKVYFDKWFSDYLYIVNLSGKDIPVRDYNGRKKVVKDNAITTFNFGRFIETISLEAEVKVELFSIQESYTMVYKGKEYIIIDSYYTNMNTYETVVLDENGEELEGEILDEKGKMIERDLKTEILDKFEEVR